MGCERRKEVMDENMVLVWVNKGWVVFNWNGNSCGRSSFEEKDKDVSLGYIKFEMYIRYIRLGVKGRC